MSDLTGHYRITRAAVFELASSRADSPIAMGMQSAGLPEAAVARDIMDVLCLGHWADFGQSHHFMRRFDSQSPYEAYESALEWIRSNALSATQQLAHRIATYFPDGIRGQRADRHRGRLLFQDVPWQSLGNAIHCVEDSFAVGHAVRSESNDDLRPGDIEHIKRYAGAEKELHEEGDEQWWDNSEERFSRSGRQAVEAVKALLRLVLDNALGSRSPRALEGWTGFCNQWLNPSPKLSREHDRIFELIDRHYVGVRVGATNVVTFYFDEEGLASDLVAESAQTVLEVFRRLDDKYNSDADDIAEIYVGKIRSTGGPKVEELRSSKPLIDILIKVMDEGWTSKGEQECIDYLKAL